MRRRDRAALQWFLAKYMGDGVLIYFGYPHADEDDAERAVRAGLELLAAVGALKTYAPLQTRVGSCRFDGVAMGAIADTADAHSKRRF